MRLTVHGREWLEGQPLGHLAQRLADRGFSYDYVSDRQLAGAGAAGGKIRVPGGEYRVLVSPRCRRMPLETLERFCALAKAGATVIFEDALPADVPGLADLDRRRAQFRNLLEALRFDPLSGGLREARIGTGRVLVGDAEAALTLARVPRESMTAIGLECIRRADTAGRRHYFVANRGPQPVEAWVTLATSARAAVLMDPMTGETGIAALRHARTGEAEVYLSLEPGRSIILRTFQQADRRRRVELAEARRRWGAHQRRVARSLPRRRAGTSHGLHYLHAPLLDRTWRPRRACLCRRRALYNDLRCAGRSTQ